MEKGKKEWLFALEKIMEESSEESMQELPLVKPLVIGLIECVDFCENGQDEMAIAAEHMADLIEQAGSAGPFVFTMAAAIALLLDREKRRERHDWGPGAS